MTWRWPAAPAALGIGAGLAVAMVGSGWLDPAGAPPSPPPPALATLDLPDAARAASGEKIDLRAPANGVAVVAFLSGREPGRDADLLRAVADLPEAEGRLLRFAVRRDPDGPLPETPLPIVDDRSGDLSRRFGVRGLPFVCLYAGSGRLLFSGSLEDGPGPLRDAMADILEGRPVAHPGRRPELRTIEPRPPAGNAPNFAADVGPILRRSCQPCHRPGQSAPFPLMTHAQAAKRAGDLAEVVTSRLMPPWPPTPGLGPPLLHDRTLLPSEIATLRAWADAGAPEGTPGPGPPPSPPPGDGWTLGAPDLVLEADAPFEIPATGPDVYRCFVLPTHLPEDRFLSAIEVRPGNPRVVHHTFSYVDVRGLGRARDRDDPGPGYMCFSGFAGDQVFGALGGWTPGNEAHAFRDGVGLHLPRDADVVVQVHYHPSGKPETDRTRLGLHFARTPVKRSLQWVSACPRPDRFTLPADDPDIRVLARLTVPMDVDLHAMTPHMHLLGRQFRAAADLPDGRTVPLIAIEDWDFNRQETYDLREPLRLPSGSVVRVEGRFDNSSANPANPNSPPRDVEWGEGTTDDMLILFLAVTQPDQDLTRPGAVDDFMEQFFRRAGVPAGPTSSGPLRLSDPRADRPSSSAVQERKSW